MRGSFIALTRNEYSLIILFGVLGCTLLISSYDLISIYLSLELQSFAMYILACIYTTSHESTSASLKYFLLGAISSAFILLGLALIYQVTGTTSFESLSILIQVSGALGNLTPGLLCVVCGYMFKISAAPFHS
jgi:NADH-ubiquinone oxidoreductase chain 2